MRRSILLGLLALTLCLPAAPLAEDGGPRAFLDLETGAVWASSNDVQVPGDTGTRFSLAGGAFSTRTAPFVRAQVGAQFGRNTVIATFAPLRLEGNGRGGGTLLFRGQTFTASDAAKAKYQFDTYRLTWRYSLVTRPRFELALGATALVRNAAIRVAEPGHATTESNVGFVPLASLRVAGNLGGPFWLTLDGDALAAKQGRAEDVALALEFRSGDVAFRAGYRLLEGGADNRKVYNFAWLNHLAVGVRYEL